MAKTKRSPELWICLIAVLIVMSTLVGVGVNIVIPRTSESDCTDLDNSDYAFCTSGEDYDKYELPLLEDRDPAILLDDEDDDMDAMSTHTNQSIRLFKGVSLSGGEIGAFNSDEVYVPYDNDALLFMSKGMDTFRLPVKWEFMLATEGTTTSSQEYFNEGLHSAFRQRLGKLIGELNAKKAVVILTLYNNMRYDTAGRRSAAGRGVIGSCSELVCPATIGRGTVPGLLAVREFWRQIVSLYRSRPIIYSFMNELNDNEAPLITNQQALLNRYIETAYQSVRETETALSLPRHFVLLPAIKSAQIQRWFEEDESGASNAKNPLFLVGNREKFDDKHGIAVHHYFDSEMNGSYSSGDCIPTEAFKSSFDVYFTRFVVWMTQNKQKIFITEFGAPDTENCRRNLVHFLDAVETAAYSPGRDYGFIGWTAWGADLAPGYVTAHTTLRRRHLSIARGGRANTLLWNASLYERFLPHASLLRSLPPLSEEKMAIMVENDSEQTLIYQDGYLPVQFVGSADVPPDGYAILWSNNMFTTPTGNLQLVYRARGAHIFINFRAESYGSFPVVEYRDDDENQPTGYALVFSTKPCPIIPSGGISSGVRCYVFR